MANVIDKLEDIELFLADIVCDMVGLDQKNVLIQYLTDGQPSFDIEQDICFVKVAQEIDERDIYKTRKWYIIKIMIILIINNILKEH